MQSKFELTDEMTSHVQAGYTQTARSPKSSAASHYALLEDRLVANERYLPRRLQHRRPSDRGQAGASEIRSRQVSPVPDAWWHSIPAAMSWLLGVLIEGFAACGEAMHPGFFNYHEAELFDLDERDEAPWRSHPVHRPSQTETSSAYGGLGGPAYEAEARDPIPQADLDRSVISAPRNSEDSTQWEPPLTASRHWSAPVKSQFAKFWSRTYRGRRTRLIVRALQDLDDRTLRDIGISRCEIEYLATRDLDE
jgi:uncharacterized protein YjiS (DUF1127 family)